ncbi:MAG TPA: GDSL-type esterase/lipase family protein [Acidimicrobiales bacterium]
MPVRDVVLAIAVVVVAALAFVGDSDASDRLDVAVVGDSFADQSRTQFLELAAREDLSTQYYAYGGSALCGWEDQLRQLSEREPDKLVLSFAGNDLSPCINPTGQPRTPEAVAADYRRDLDRVIEMFRPAGTDIYVVEPPPIRDANFEANAAAMRDMYRDATTDHPRITVIDPATTLGPDHAFHAALPCQAGEACGPDGTVVLRQDDGIHLTPAGGGRYAQAVMEGLER